MFLDLEQRDWAARIEVGGIWFGVKVLLGDVAVVCGLQPVSRFNPSAAICEGSC